MLILSLPFDITCTLSKSHVTRGQRGEGGLEGSQAILSAEEVREGGRLAGGHFYSVLLIGNAWQLPANFMGLHVFLPYDYYYYYSTRPGCNVVCPGAS